MIIETELRLTKKIAKVEEAQKNKALYYAAELEKCASAYTKLTKITQNLYNMVLKVEVKTRLLPKKVSEISIRSRDIEV